MGTATPSFEDVGRDRRRRAKRGGEVAAAGTHACGVEKHNERREWEFDLENQFCKKSMMDVPQAKRARTEGPEGGGPTSAELIQMAITAGYVTHTSTLTVFLARNCARCTALASRAPLTERASAAKTLLRHTSTRTLASRIAR